MITGHDWAAIFRDSPAGQAAMSEIEQAKAKQRAELQQQVAEAQAAHDKKYPKLSAARAESAAKVREAEKALAAATLELRRAHIACDSAMNTLENLRGTVLQRLKTDLVDPQIPEFLAEVRETIDALRKAGPDRIAGRLWSPRDGSFMAGTSNSQAWQAHIAALVAILARQDELYLASDPKKAIAAARASLPAFEGVYDDPVLARQILAVDAGVPAVAAGVVNAAAEAVGL